MLKYTVLLFLRNIRRQKLFSGINLLGLTVSIASTLLIYLYVRHEFSHDRFHENVDRIYRVNQTFIWGENNSNQFASTGPGVAYALHQELPEAELITSIHTPGSSIISYTAPDNSIISFEEEKILAADSNFFRMFNFPLLKGSKEAVFDQMHSMVMTASTAKKYFGKENPIGKLVRLSGADDKSFTVYEVTGIVEDVPDNSYIEFDVLLSLRGFPMTEAYWSWVWTQLETYIKLDSKANPAYVQDKLSEIPEKYLGETMRLAFNTTWEEYIKSGKKWELFLQSMGSIHLPSETVINRLNDSGNITIIYSFIGVAIFITLLSCVNFMNLSTAQFTKRLKEAGVRKILGLEKSELILGYFMEALAFCLMALVAALLLTYLLLPQFNLITDKNLRLDLLGDPMLVFVLIGITFFMAVVSASYPAIFLSTFHPIEAVKGKIKVGSEGRLFRNGLVVFQFSVSIILIICTAVVFQQLRYVSMKNIGFDRDNLLVLRHVEAVKNGENLADAAVDIPGVIEASWCSSVPPRLWGGDTFGIEENHELRFPMNFTGADEHYIPTLSIAMKAGRNFSKDNPADIDRVIVNEATVKKIGWEVNESVIGKRITYENAAFEIVGVVADFNYWSLSNPIEPMAIFHMKTDKLYAEKRHYLALKIASQDSDSWNATLAGLRHLWKAHAGDAPFDYFFVDQAFSQTFRSQHQFGKVLTVMAALALLIAGLGLFGMIIYTLEQRTKEIGIRKVSGASVLDILLLFSQGYAKLIAAAFVFGAPLSYWLMHLWLRDFAYRVRPSFWIFAVTGLGTLLVVLLITGYHSAKAALTNPVKVLRDE